MPGAQNLVDVCYVGTEISPRRTSGQEVAHALVKVGLFSSEELPWYLRWGVEEPGNDNPRGTTNLGMPLNAPLSPPAHLSRKQVEAYEKSSTL
jgi:hypothetical protein